MKNVQRDKRGTFFFKSLEGGSPGSGPSTNGPSRLSDISRPFAAIRGHSRPFAAIRGRWWGVQEKVYPRIPDFRILIPPDHSYGTYGVIPVIFIPNTWVKFNTFQKLYIPILLPACCLEWPSWCLTTRVSGHSRHSRPFAAIRGHSRPFAAPHQRGSQKIFAAIRGHSRPFAAIRGHSRRWCLPGGEKGVGPDPPTQKS